MSTALRKLVLTAHVTFSVGWLGAVATFLALAITGLQVEDVETVRAAYLAMKIVAWLVIVPASVGSLLTGVIQGLGGTWGLFRHYWVVIKLVLTVVASAILALHLQPIDLAADLASRSTVLVTDLGDLRSQLVFDSAAALIVLLTTTVLSVYKPKGLTRYGLRGSSGTAPAP